MLGLVGLIIAVPILATIKILIEELWIKPLEERSGTLSGDLMRDGSVAAGAARVSVPPDR